MKTICSLFSSLALLVAGILLTPVARSAPVEFASAGGITINNLLYTGPGNPYPSSITVTNAGVVSAVRVKINGFSSIVPGDVDVFLVAPNGRVSAVFSDVGTDYLQISNVNFVIDDAASANLPANSTLVSGTYKPINVDPVEALPPGATGPIGTNLSALAANGANGVWKLFVTGDGGGDNGGGGTIASWALVLETTGATVTTPTATAITTTTATLGGNVTGDGVLTINSRGVVLAPTATDSDPVIGGTGVTSLPSSGTTGVFTVNASSLSSQTPYTYKAYATTSAGTSYSVAGSFSTRITLTYTAGANGTLTGITPQTVDYGADGTTVTAVPAIGYHFVNWSDSSTANPRTDTNVTAGLNVTANFAFDTVSYTTGTEIPLSVAGFTATGSTVVFQLNHAPSPGTQLMVVENTGLNFIQGTFGNLTQGQVVVLTYAGEMYPFVANYHGGTGNDLVLVWQDTRPVAWGVNSSGQLGDTSTTQKLVPVAVNSSGVLAGKTVLAVAGWVGHSLALCSDGTLAAWGAGPLGDTNTNSSTVPVAVDRSGVLAGKTVVAIAAGWSHSLALCSDGTVAAWGSNSSGQLGNNSATYSTVPVAVDVTGVLSGKTVVAVAAKGYYSMALCSDGTLAAWGLNTSGQLGNNSTTNSPVPVAVDSSGVLAGKIVIALAAGDRHSLALCSDGTLTAWGDGAQGRLGNNGTTNSPVPVAVHSAGVLAGKTPVAVSAGYDHSLALCSDGTLTAWGRNDSAQLGNNSTNSSAVPVVVVATGVLAGKTVTAVAGGRAHTLARCSDGTLAAWGINTDGQLGNNSTNFSPLPTAVDDTGVLAGTKSVAVSACYDHSLALASWPRMPDILVEQPLGTPLADGAGNIDFGAVAVGGSAPLTFAITNPGWLELNSLVVTKDGANADDFTVSALSATSLPGGGGSVTFEVTFSPLAMGSSEAALHIASNVSGDQNPYDITLVGTGSGSFIATYTTGDEVPVSGAVFTATGSTVAFALNIAPSTGTQLMVVENTGLDFIQGTFGNLTQGQVVVLSYAGGMYPFVANYHGGTGNDLVLVWQDTRPVAWGANSSGQLGNNSTTNSSVPVAVNTSGLLAGKTVLALAEGSSHSLALCSDGTLAAWGYNFYGQLGNNSTIDRSLPVAVNLAGVLAGKTVVAVAAGNSHSLALCSDGTLAAWGSNSYGQLGNNSTTSSYVPVAVNTSGVLAGKTVVGVSAGGSHSLALCSDGTLAAWGYNIYGQLGNNSSANSAVPVAVNTSVVLAGKTVVGVSAGYEHSMALCSDGTLTAWGRNQYGQLGNSSLFSSSPLPVGVDSSVVLAGKTVVALAAGSGHSMALCSDGTLAAWGRNGSGQLGNTSTTSSIVPVAVVTSGVLAGKTVVALAAGAEHSMARCSDGTLAAWGYNFHGQLGNNSTANSTVPVAVDATGVLADKTLVALGGGYHSLALAAWPLVIDILVEQPPGTPLADGASNIDFGAVAVGGHSPLTFTITNPGDLGLNSLVVTKDGANADDFTVSTLSETSLPAGSGSVTFEVTFSPLATGFSQAALHVASNVSGSKNPYDIALEGRSTGNFVASYSTGQEVPGSVANFTATDWTVDFALNYAPVPGTQLMVVENRGIDFIQGTLGNLTQGQVVSLSHAGVSYSFVANYYGGTGNDLVLVWQNTRAVAWGSNASGQLGDNNSPTNSLLPTSVDRSGVLAGKTILAVAGGVGGSTHSFALCSDGTLAAWGLNTFGQLGDNSLTESSVPVTVDYSGVLAGKTVVAIAVGFSHSLALCSDGTLAAWGLNTSGQLGDNSLIDSSVPVVVNSSGALAGQTVVTIAAGNTHSLALCSDGTVAAWGLNSFGQLGNNSLTLSTVPVAVDASGLLVGKTVVALAAGLNHSLALCSDGTLAAWGGNGAGRLGDNTTTNRSVPVAVNTSGVLAGKTVVAISVGTAHNLALCSDGTLVAWGNNISGRLGDNSTTNRSVPVAVDTSGVLAGKTVVTVAAGGQHSLVRCSDGTLAAWGLNTSGQLGDNSLNDSSVPVAVNTSGALAGQTVVGLVAGGTHNLAFVAPAPDIAVTQTIALTDGGAGVDFGDLTVGGNTPLTFTLTNTGTADLANLVVTTEGADAARFIVSSLSGNSIPEGAGTVTFNVTFSPTTSGPLITTLRIASNVSGTKNPFDITLQGTGISALETWRQAWFGPAATNTGDAADDVDPYHTGIPNILVFAFLGPNQDPATAQTSQLPQATSNGGFFTYQFTEPVGTSGITYGAQWSATLGNDWQPVPDTGTTPEHIFSMPVDGARKFLRLTVQ